LLYIAMVDVAGKAMRLPFECRACFGCELPMRLGILLVLGDFLNA
jgi:hypothetical protein